jgi:predicted pyridoxine 5'-phosphate oxidase superfamily flavin-nucleotide-binding protein
VFCFCLTLSSREAVTKFRLRGRMRRDGFRIVFAEALAAPSTTSLHLALRNTRGCRMLRFSEACGFWFRLRFTLSSREAVTKFRLRGRMRRDGFRIVFAEALAAPSTTSLHLALRNTRGCRMLRFSEACGFCFCLRFTLSSRRSGFATRSGSRSEVEGSLFFTPSPPRVIQHACGSAPPNPRPTPC